eukprot:CAMPEP_0182877816 /NCGR_PEP_ID=MMETSP0034_2-20130328/14979_1 /TAXON_ID=156128 /ORGANISM="Nephroselmis pyriformis, Strain CCMP717" /LENGTH=546 /DNA_ID=CAMNT_0025010681 /DNA_START=385 /DNA_END=2021 /DNA_ORIENTATION=+
MELELSARERSGAPETASLLSLGRGSSGPAPPVQRDPLTFRAVAIGCLVGMVTATMNVSFGLKAGWSQGGSILAAVVSIGVFSAMRPSLPFTAGEANICQTTASAAGMMTMAAGFAGPIPALQMLGYEYSTTLLLLWAFSVCYLGVFFAAPLRQALVVKENLRFPTGTATYHTILSMFAEGGEATARSRLLFRSAVLAAAWTTLGYFLPFLEKPKLLPHIGLGALARLGWGINLDLQLIGGGMLCGVHTGCSIFAGAVVAWGILAPAVHAAGWAPGPFQDYGTGGAGVGAVARRGADGRGRALELRDLRALEAPPPAQHAAAAEDPTANASDGDSDNPFDPHAFHDDEPDGLRGIPLSWSVGGLVASSACTASVLSSSFGLPPWQPLLAVVVAALLSYIAVRCTGETDINPVGGMGKVTQLIFAVIAPNQIVTNLMAAAVAGAAASQAGDLSQDFKAGRLLKTCPRKQFAAQLIGIPFGALAAVPVYRLFQAAYTFGGEEAPAPAAQAWKAVAEVLSRGTGALPPMSGIAMGIALAVGAALPVLSR